MITNDSANNVNSDLGCLFFESEDLIRRCMAVQYLDECFGTLYDDRNLAHNLLDGKSWVDWMWVLSVYVGDFVLLDGTYTRFSTSSKVLHPC